MRGHWITTGVLAVVVAVPGAVSAQENLFQGFGGVTFGDVTNSSTFGGSIAIPLSDNLQIIGEGGRMTNVMPSLYYDLLEFTPVEFGVSAWYGEGGLRFIASPGRTVRPYLETTAGLARLNARFDGAGSRADAVVNMALRFYDRTDPILGAGGGVVVQGGPIFLDLGYRYQKILVGDSLQGLMTGGDIGINQVRFGAGIRF